MQAILAPFTDEAVIDAAVTGRRPPSCYGCPARKVRTKNSHFCGWRLTRCSVGWLNQACLAGKGAIVRLLLSPLAREKRHVVLWPQENEAFGYQ